MKKILLLLVIIILASNANAQTDSSAAHNLKASADDMAKLFLAKRYDGFVKYTHPKIISLAGGKDNMVQVIKKSMADLAADGLAVSNVSVGEPSGILAVNNELQAVVPQNLELKTDKGTLLSTSYLLAFSTDKGKTWYFVDTAGKTLEKMKSIFPGLSNQLIIPERKQPIMVN